MRTHLPLLVLIALFLAPVRPVRAERAFVRERFDALFGGGQQAGLDGKVLSGFAGTLKVTLRVSGQHVTGWVGPAFVHWKLAGNLINGPYASSWVSLRVAFPRVSGVIGGHFTTLTISG
jgi:hypothetical protein